MSRLSNGQILRADVRNLSAMIRSNPKNNSREAIELAERIRIIEIAVAPLAVEYATDLELSADDLRKILTKVVHILDNTTELRL